MDLVGAKAVTAAPPSAAEWIARVFDDHADVIYTFASRRVGATIAKDVVSEVFLIALQRMASYDPFLGSERGWLFGIANNVVRRHWRSELRRMRALARQHETAAATDGMAASDARIDAARLLPRVMDVVVTLDDEDRELVVMFAWQRLSYQEIAEVLRVPIGTVRSRLHRVRVRLAADVEGSSDE